MRKTTSPYISVRKSKIHGTGVFAKKDIPAETRVIEYVGKRLTKAQSSKIADLHIERSKKDKDHGAVYLFELNKRIDIDGRVWYNTARYINHSCDPNCETDIIRGKIWIISLRDIKKGEEILYNYGYGFDDYDEHPCYCNTKRCIGYILEEDLWPRLKRDLKRKKEARKKKNQPKADPPRAEKAKKKTKSKKKK